MKLYCKEIEGKLVIKPSNEIVLNDGKYNIVNAKEEVLISHGWSLYEPVKEENAETLESVKDEMIYKITKYDSSNVINTFYIDGTPVWFNKNDRIALRNRFNTESKIGLKRTTLWYNNIPYEMTLEDAIIMMDNLELYASYCFDNTQRHIHNVKSMTDVDEIKNYNYRTGYNKPLNITLN
jgi:hypothetical protein